MEKKINKGALFALIAAVTAVGLGVAVFFFNASQKEPEVEAKPLNPGSAELTSDEIRKAKTAITEGIEGFGTLGFEGQTAANLTARKDVYASKKSLIAPGSPLAVPEPVFKEYHGTIEEGYKLSIKTTVESLTLEPKKRESSMGFNIIDAKAKAKATVYSTRYSGKQQDGSKTVQRLTREIPLELRLILEDTSGSWKIKSIDGVNEQDKFVFAYNMNKLNTEILDSLDGWTVLTSEVEAAPECCWG